MTARKSLAIAMAVVAGLFLALDFISPIVCQDFEDLNNQHLHGLLQPTVVQQVGASQQVHKIQHHNSAQPQQTFQPLNRQAQSSSTSKHSMQRPILSSRFAQSNPIVPQASPSSSSAVFASPSGVQSAPVSSATGGVNVEQLMKNALARTAQLNSAAVGGPEQRQDTSGQSSDGSSSPASSTVARSLPVSTPVAQTSSSNTPVAAVASTNQADSTSTDSSLDEANIDSSKSSVPHETVYSDQRFANLFARRNNAKKSRIQPLEQVKAKPTLPSFIKSPPDPKQFNAAQAATQDKVAASSSSSNTFATQRLQQATQNRANLANQQLKKGAITSTSANIANNKRASSITSAKLGAQQNSSNLSATGKGQKVSTTSKPATQLGSNPFNRSPNSNSDPANVIAMARKRLLANNALETAKAKQQSQQKPTTK